jgi:stage II sporulation protein AA (anti-sigma F factor antagonist)
LAVAAIDNLTVTTAEDDPNLVIVDGQIDSHTSPVLDKTLTARLADAEIAVDLSRVSFIDSSGLRVLVRAHKRQAESGGRLMIVAPSEPVCRLFDITGLTSELSISE